MKITKFIVAFLSIGLIVSSITAAHFHQKNERLKREFEMILRMVPDIPEISTQPTAPINTSVSLVSEPEASAPSFDEPDDRISELESALRERDEELERLRGRFRPIQEARQESEAPVDRQTWLENLRTEDPDRYAEIVRRREDMRQRVNDSFARKASHFLYRDTSSLDSVEQEEYELMLGLLAQTWQLAERMQSVELERHERWEIGREVMANVRELTPMLEAERDREFFELALQIGYDESTASEFVDYINDMIEISTFQSIWRGMRGGWGRGMREE